MTRFNHSDPYMRYVHYPLDISGEQSGNLMTLARYLARNSQTIESCGRFRSDIGDMLSMSLKPGEVTQALLVSPRKIAPSDSAAPDNTASMGTGTGTRAELVALALGPLAGITPDGYDQSNYWDGYCEAHFGIALWSAPYDWIQDRAWAKTDPGPYAAALRIVYLITYGIPINYMEIAIGQAYPYYRYDETVWQKLNQDLQVRESAVSNQSRHGQSAPSWPPPIRAREWHARYRSIWLGYGNLAHTLETSGIAHPDTIRGLSDEESSDLIATWGAMPQSYLQVLSIIGHDAGRLVNDIKMLIYADQLERINALGRLVASKWECKDGDPVPDRALFVGVNERGHYWFILKPPPAPMKRRDSAVFLLDGNTGRISQVAISVWEWLQAIVEQARQSIAAGNPNPTRRKNDSTP